MDRARTLVAIACIAAVTPSQTPLTVHRMMELRQVSQAVISPDGAHVAYALSVPRSEKDPDGRVWSELHLVPYEGGKSRGLLTGYVSVRRLGFTPDGELVTFLARRKADRTTRLYGIDPEGGPPRALTADGISISTYAFSPDGSRIAYTTRAPYSSKKKAERKAGFTQEVYEEELRFVRLHVMNRKAKKGPPLKLTGSVHAIQWSADGESLFFTMSPTPLTDDRYMRQDLYRVHLGSGKVTTLADVPGKIGAFAASPSGAKVAYIAGRDINDPAASSLYVVGKDGGWSVSLTPSDFQGHVDSVVWLDADHLLIQGTEGCHRTIYRQPASGGNRTMVVSGGVAALGALSASADKKRMVSVGSTSRHPAEVFALDTRGRPRRLTDSNPGLGDVALGAQEIVRYKARDGLEIEGLLIKPVGYKAGTKYPLIVAAHGGPESCYVNGWLTRYATPGQMAAGEGYVVFYPNYRSSTGRGVAFSKAGQGDAVGAEFNDVLDGVDHLIREGLADPDRVGITGGSYGGYFSAWAATRHTARFRASVMFVGVSNQVSKVGTTDIPQESYYSHWKVRPWEDIDLYLERSPILYARQAQTPLLIMHGKDDPRVSPTQSLELYRWIKLKGDVPVRLVWYEKEGHGNRRRSSQLDYALRMMRWFRHFLKGDGKKLPPAGVDYRAR